MIAGWQPLLGSELPPFLAENSFPGIENELQMEDRVLIAIPSCRDDADVEQAARFLLA
jgi:hypothetical protein